jgi:hypothetical protein
LAVWKGNFWQFGKEIFDILEKKILTVWKRKFWQFEKESYDSLEKENFDSLESKILTVWKGKFHHWTLPQAKLFLGSVFHFHIYLYSAMVLVVIFLSLFPLFLLDKFFCCKVFLFQIKDSLVTSKKVAIGFEFLMVRWNDFPKYF